MSKRSIEVFDDDDEDGLHLFESTPIQTRRGGGSNSAAPDSLSVRSQASSSSGSSYAPSRAKQSKRPHLSNLPNKQTHQRRQSSWTEFPIRAPASSNIAHRLGGKPVLSPLHLANTLGTSPSASQNQNPSQSAVAPLSEEERLAACYAALTKQSAVQSTYKCPLPSASPRAHSDTAIGNSLLSFANWVAVFPSQPFGIDRTPASVLLAPSAADSQFFTVLCSETAANWSFLNETGKLLPQVFGESLQGPLLPLSVIQATGNTPALLSIIKNRPIQLEFFSPLASNTFIPSLNGPLNALPPQNQIRSIFVNANPESVPASFQHFFICFKRFASAANLFFIDGTGHPFRAEEFSHFLEFLESGHIGFPSLTFHKFKAFFAEWTSFCCTPIRSASTAFLTLTRLSAECPERTEIWSRTTGLPPVPPAGPAREIWLARAIAANALSPAPARSSLSSSSHEPASSSSSSAASSSSTALALAKTRRAKKFISVQVNDIRGLKHEGKELCLGWNAHNCFRQSCYRAHICVYCFKESSLVESHKAWDIHEHLRVQPKNDQSAGQQPPQGPFP
ncbi:hypothetical protein BDR26DRAFT_980624 [Obelidium mucronatum]|nr:hypothetical protein BDR26DRAFT_980624 [Obelidium mucronatum]